MSLVLVVLLGALGAGLLLGGRLRRLGELPLRAPALVPASVGAQLLGAVAGGAAYALGLLVSALLVAVFLLRNRRREGTAAVALGLASNALVVVLNGAMPVWLPAASWAGADVRAVVAGQDARHEPADAGTRLRALGDVVPVPLPRGAQVVSPGDVLVAAGLARWVLTGMGAGPVVGSRSSRGGRPLPRLPPPR